MSLGADFEIKRRATLPVLTIDCLNDNGQSVDLSTATSVTFSMEDSSGNIIIGEQPGTIDTANNRVSYAWQTADTAGSGGYRGEFDVTFPTGIMTFPTEGFLSIVIFPDIT